MLISIKSLGPKLHLLSKNVCRAFATSTNIKEEKIKVRKWDINYVKVGTGTHNILMLPGALGTVWTEAKPLLEGFDREKFTLVAWDPPGYGKSRPPEKDFATDFYEQDADMAYEFMKALGISKYSVLGFSDGGTTALIHTAKYPDMVTKLVAWSTNSYILPKEIEAYKKIKDINGWSQAKRDQLIQVYGEKFAAEYWSRWVDNQVAIYEQNNGNICSELLKDIKCPTFILYGHKDALVDIEQISYFRKHIKDCRTHEYPEGTHLLHLRFAEDFNKRVQDFLLLP